MGVDRLGRPRMPSVEASEVRGPATAPVGLPGMEFAAGKEPL